MSHSHRATESVLFRVDGSSEHGVAMGHIYRCLRLAKMLSDFGIDSYFCMKHNHASHSLVQSNGFKIDSLPNYRSQEKILEHISGIAIDRNSLLYIDLRNSKKNLVDYARQKEIPTIVYDDVFEDGLSPNLLINPTESCKDKYVEQKVNYMLGKKNIILDPRQSKYRKDIFSPKILKLFVCFGGADPCNLTIRVIKLLLRTFHELNLLVAIGPAYQQEEKLKKIINKYDLYNNVTIHKGKNFLAPIMNQTDAAITSGGTIMCEAIDICLPVLALPSINHEVDVINSYRMGILAESIPCDVNSIGNEELKIIIKKFISSQSLRKKIFESQLKFESFSGVRDIANYIKNYFLSK